ncbi:MAG: cysteine desulfurase family protein [Pseudomonadota bacterium]
MSPAPRSYLDYNATAPLRPQAREAVLHALDTVGNPSSVHGEGRNAKRLVEAARAQIADLVNASPEGVVFTSGATEAAMLALTPNLFMNGKARPAGALYVLETEHPCVLAGGRFDPEQTMGIPVHRDGLIDLDQFDALLEAHDDATGAPFVAVQLANSETGVIQPIQDIAERVHLRGGYLLCDAVQAAGRIPLDAKALGVDFLLLSGHKLGGPQGVGALIIAHDSLGFAPVLMGGGQEKNRRAGTENVAAIAGFGAAAEVAKDGLPKIDAVATLRDSLEQRIATICTQHNMAESLNRFGTTAQRLANTSLFSLNGQAAETALIAFDLAGVAVSSGSACSSGKVASSHVLAAMNVPPSSAKGAIRVSLGWASTQTDVDRFCTAFETQVKRLAAKRATATPKQELTGAA